MGARIFVGGPVRAVNDRGEDSSSIAPIVR
jgi:hypothetical protein